MDDTFSLSIGQAHQLEKAFARNGWTAADVHYLSGGTILRDVLAFVSNHREAALGQTRPIQECSLKSIFTYELCCQRLGYAKSGVTRLLNDFRNENDDYHAGKKYSEKLETIADLLALSRSRLLRIPNCGWGSLKLIEDVLQQFGLKLAES